MGVEFEWDANKSRANLAKHGITFEDAVAVFDDPRELTERSRFEGEPRYQTIGRVRGTVLFVAYTIRPGSLDRASLRIISARVASREERARYGR
jgi:hypothetical protein